jgi:steroid 5-alpha reductase family enzyme
MMGPLIVSFIASLLTLFVAWSIGGGVSVGGVPALLLCAGLALGIQWVAFIPCALARTEKLYDLTGGLTYITVVGFALWAASDFGELTLRHWVVSVMVLIWAFRLATFLFRRVHRAGKDGRFDAIKVSPTRFFMSWTLQGMWVFMAALPVFVLLTAGRSDVPLGPWDLVGWGLWLLGFGLETVADQQKSVFNACPENRGKWVNTGLWRYSQHPNYFGEIVLWTGITLSGFGVYEGVEWLALLSPVFVYVLLTRVSGIPLLRQRGESKWGQDPEYQAYRAETAVLVPRRPSRR